MNKVEIALIVFNITLFLAFNVLSFYLLKKVYFEKFRANKIFAQNSTSKQHRHEFKRSLATLGLSIFFTLATYRLYINGFTPIHDRWDQWGILYYFVSFYILQLYHDTYFYWSHRAFHEISWLKKFHHDHHISKIPTPLSTNSFSFVEGIVQSGFFITAAIFIPAHWSMHLFFYTFVAWIAFWGHVEFEFWPNSLYRLPFGNTFNSLTHHNIHHFFGKGNYGLYYRFWDEVCGTLHPQTYPHFYKVQKQIAASKGIIQSEFRPDAQDIVGLYFEQAEAFGEDINIIMDQTDNFEGVKSFDLNQINTIPHSYCDGISALKVFHKKNELNLSMVSKINNIANSNSKIRLKAKAFEFLKIITRLPYRKFNWHKSESQVPKLWSLGFNEKETQQLINYAQKMKISLNFLLIDLIDKQVEKYLTNRIWAIPHWTSNKYENAASAPIANHASFFEYESSKELNISHKYQYYKNQFLGASRYWWQMSYLLLTSFLKYPFKFFVWVSLWATKRTGAISNLGTYIGEGPGVILFSPPVLKNNPLSIGIITYNGKLTISAHSKNRCGPSNEMIEEILKNLRNLILSIKNID